MTDLDLVNAALNEMGQTALVSLDQTTNSAVVATAKIQLERVKRETLRLRDWNSVRRRKEMQTLDAAALSLGEWSQAYRLPPDCLAARRFVSTFEDVKHAKFSIENDEDGKKVLFTDCGNNLLVYTADVTDVNRWDALLFGICATRLAIQFAITLTRDLKFLSTHWEIYQRKLDECTGVDEAEGGIEDVYTRDLVNVRF